MTTKNQLEEITNIQIKGQIEFRSVPDSGKEIIYLGKKFIVYPNIFWPSEDSMPLVENYVINPGEYVLDVCTGCGVIAVFSAYKGAKKVVAVDINPDSVKTARENARRHGFSKIIDVKLSNMFEAISEEEKFDVVTANLPFRNKKASDLVEASQWDTSLQANKHFFANVGKYLKLNGRIYIAQANYGAVEEIKQFANKSGFSIKKIGEKIMPDNLRIFYAFELIRK